MNHSEGTALGQSVLSQALEVPAQNHLKGHEPKGFKSNIYEMAYEHPYFNILNIIGLNFKRL